MIDWVWPAAAFETEIVTEAHPGEQTVAARFDGPSALIRR
jgi:hypothetical protein